MNESNNIVSGSEEKLFKSPLAMRIIGLGKPYFVKTPWWLKKVYSSFIWDIDTKENIIYLTFDDGPHPIATPFVLDELKKYNAKATFFCIGKNVTTQSDIYKRIIAEGHAIGNHTQNHLNGWKTKTDDYLDDFEKAAVSIDSNLFRPPYGRITSKQAEGIKNKMKGKKGAIIMWDVLSADFDTAISPQKCLANVASKTRPGSIIVFHDSEKAFTRMNYALPQVLDLFSKKGYRFEKLASVYS